MADEKTGIAGDVAGGNSGNASASDGASGADDSNTANDSAGSGADSANAAAGSSDANQAEADQGKENVQDDVAAQEAEQKEDAPDPENTPISDWESVDLGLGEDAVDGEVLKSFGKAAVDLGLTPKQARVLAQWQLDTIAESRTALLETGAEELRKDWGRKNEANQRAVLTLIANVDRKLGNDAFSKALGISGATCHAGVIKGLHAIASMLSEDAMGAGKGAPMPDKPESALEGIENAFREMKARA